VIGGPIDLGAGEKEEEEEENQRAVPLYRM
jgi:hypothetical protein